MKNRREVDGEHITLTIPKGYDVLPEEVMLGKVLPIGKHYTKSFIIRCVSLLYTGFMMMCLILCRI